MEADRFDAITRSVASRRSLVARVGGGGLGALLAGALGFQEASAATTCALDVRLFVRFGPSAGVLILPEATQPGQLTGQLRLTISSKGDLAGLTFAFPDGSSFPVTGSVSSHLFGARVTLAKGRVLVLQGVDDGAVAACHGAIDGSFVGPREGDLGDWHASVAPDGAPTATATATAATVSGSGIVPTSIAAAPTDTSATDTATAAPPAPTETNVPDTPTETPTEILCSECQTAQGGSGCQPIADDTPCSGGLCCQGFCADLSHNPNHCGSCANICDTGCCHGSACVDLTSDPSSCGVCGHACGSGMICLQAVCTVVCPTGEINCGGACVNLTDDPNNCGACGQACASSQICLHGVCTLVCPTGEINCGGTCFKGKICP